MTDSRSRVGPAVAVTAAALLAVSVFLPWYGVTITAQGAAAAQQTLQSVAAQYGNANLQAETNALGSDFSTIAGRQIATLSAHQALKTSSVILLLLAALAFVGGLVLLTDASGPIQVGGGQLAAVGSVATLLVLYRMASRPGSPAGYVSLSLHWGILLALVSSAAIVVGGLIGRASGPRPRYGR